MFDQVFPINATQEDIYNSCAKQIVKGKYASMSYCLGAIFCLFLEWTMNKALEESDVLLFKFIHTLASTSLTCKVSMVLLNIELFTNSVPRVVLYSVYGFLFKL